MRELLIRGAQELGVSLDDTATDRLFRYKEFLQEYNKKVNLTAIVDDEDIIVKHFLDSLTVLPHLKIGENTKIIDIGTGAGFPGLVIKIAREKVDLTLLDSLRKRIVFLEEAVKMLGLDGAECHHARAEEFLRQRKDIAGSFDYALSRAVAALPKLTEYCLPYVKPGGMFIAMKGRNYKDEVAEACGVIKRLGGEICEIKEIPLPGSDIVHSLVKIRKNK
ncbi:MAG: 16S rRNA (guanine(527)-N(7))-methyltransferase RsmG [Defluviitaleaceae bacterium]|nr:16S rRNA (guanine(527)-N(7))-methyltransferase RsmG [Defluviitaleaceae bacterium]